MTKMLYAIAFAVLPLAAVMAQTPETAGDGAEMPCEMMHNDGAMDHGAMDQGTTEHGAMSHGDDAASTPEGHADHGAMMSDEDMQAMHERCAAMHHPSHGS